MDMNLQYVENELRTDAGRDWATPLWVAALLTFAVGDVALTMFGIHVVGAVEQNPAAAGAIGEFGLLVLIPFKVAVVAAFYAAYRYVSPAVRVAIPAGLTFLGSAIVGWNLVVVAIMAGVL